MSDIHRTSKVRKFVEQKVALMEAQQKVIEHGRRNNLPGLEIIEANQTAMYNYTFDLCKEFGLEMPHVLGVTPNISSY